MENRPWTRIALAAALVLLVFAAFSPALRADFVDWDDERNFVNNHAYRGLSPEHLAWMATTRHMGHYQPLSWLTLGIDHALWGMDARGYHFTSLLLHALAAVVFCSVARRLLALGTRGAAPHGLPLDLAATFAACLFAVHPLRCESVAWVTERRDVLSGLLLLLTLRWYLVRAAAEGAAARRGYGLPLAFYGASLLAKAAGMVLPAVLLLLDRWPLERFRREAPRKLLLEKLPFLGLALASATLAVWAARFESATFSALADHGIAPRSVQAGYALTFYAARTIWPADLVPIRELPAPFRPSEPRWIGPALAAWVGTLLLFLARRRSPAAWTAWLGYALLLAPFSGLAQAGPQLVADRYSYLACMPFAVLAAGGLLVWTAGRPARRVPALQLGAGLVLCLSIATWRQTWIWQDGETLWSATLERDPDNATAHQNLGVLRMRAGTRASDPGSRARLWGQALALFQRGHALWPRPEFLVNQGLVHMLLADLHPAGRQSQLARALELVERGLALQAARPGGISPAWELQHGIVLLELGRNAEAAACLEGYVRQRPDEPEGLRLLSIALSGLGRAEEALLHLERALAVDPLHAQLWIRFGITAAELGRVVEARRALERGLELRRRALGPEATSDLDVQQAIRELERLPPAR
jgi:tetratricopeptide (TPR) repeat protein